MPRKKAKKAEPQKPIYRLVRACEVKIGKTLVGQGETFSAPEDAPQIDAWIARWLKRGDLELVELEPSPSEAVPEGEDGAPRAPEPEDTSDEPEPSE